MCIYGADGTQALGQCKAYLGRHLPEATLVGVASTAGAAKILAETKGPCTDAAVCSKICADLYDGLEVLAEGIQDVNCEYISKFNSDTNRTRSANLTRFMVLGSNREACLPGSKGVIWRRGLIRVRVGKGCAVEPVVRKVGMRVRQLDRRPSLSGGGDEYFVEVEAEEKVESGEWEERVRGAAEGVQGIVLGVWM